MKHAPEAPTAKPETRRRRVSSKERRVAVRAELYARADRGELDLREAIKMMRTIAGRSQVEYAQLVGVSPRVLIEFERGIGNPTLRTLEKMIAPLGMEITLRRRRER